MQSGDADLSGRRLGSYRLLAPVGAGGFGAVYLAEHVEIHMQRAVKVLREDVADRPEFRARFLREARIAATFDHPSIVRVHDYGIDQGVQYLVMEHIDAETLAERMAVLPPRQRLADQTIRQAIRDVGAALDHAHAREVVHRDLKPANVLLRRADGRALLTDFGIARRGLESDLTRTDRSLGTYAYMSPEQCRGDEALTPRSDVYAFAALLFEIATGHPPYGRGMAAVAGHLAADGPVASARDVDPELSPGLDAVLRRGLARGPADRHGSAGELAAAFEAAAAGGPPARAAWPRRRLIAVAMTLAVAGLAAPIAAWRLLPLTRPNPTSRSAPARPTPAPAARRSWPRYAYDPNLASDVVRAIQLLLVFRGLNIGPPGPDGFYGSYTQNAVLRFQQQNALPAHGTVDDPTWEKLVVRVGPRDHGSDVEAVQRLLRHRDSKLTLSPDGTYGQSTEAAVRAMQKASRLPQTGRLDLDSWCVLVGGRLLAPTAAPQRSPVPGGQAALTR